jgi:hypothetical protein
MRRDPMLEEFARSIVGVPGRTAEALGAADDAALRRRPGPAEWSSIEVVGHLIDKMEIWRQRVERIASEERPVLELYDQDRLVEARGYGMAAVVDLMEKLEERCTSFANLLRELQISSAERAGVHPEYGEITLRRCVEIPLESIGPHLHQLQAAKARAAPPTDE